MQPIFACLLLSATLPALLGVTVPQSVVAIAAVALPERWPTAPFDRDLTVLDAADVTLGRRFPSYTIVDAWPSLSERDDCGPTWHQRLLWPLDGLQAWLGIPWESRYRFGAPGCFASTRWLRSRAPGSAEPQSGVVISTQCAPSGCVDRLSLQGKPVTGGRPAWVGADRDRFGNPSADSFDRYIGVFGNSTLGYVSILVGEQSYGAGAAHYNYSLQCRTFAEDGTRPLRLRHFLGARGEALLLAHVDDLFRGCEDDKSLFACDEGPSLRTLYWPVPLGADDFRIESAGDRELPRIILCMHGSGGIVEIAIDDIPVTLLLR